MRSLRSILFEIHCGDLSDGTWLSIFGYFVLGVFGLFFGFSLIAFGPESVGSTAFGSILILLSVVLIVSSLLEAAKKMFLPPREKW